MFIRLTREKHNESQPKISTDPPIKLTGLGHPYVFDAKKVIE